MSIVATNIKKNFGTFEALKGVSIEVKTGELVALLGPSGSGKTTLLRIIAGLEQAAEGSGDILFHEENVSARCAAERRVGFVFQHYALFRHMTVFENVAFGLRVMRRKVRPTQTEIDHRVRELLKLVQLEWLANRYPSQLSGGQRQRVALARALAVQPSVLLLDEPFGALDAKVRKELRQWLRQLHEEIHVTSVFVTHDQEEALEVADRVVIMNSGRIEQVGSPAEVFHRPANEFVMRFLGEANVFHGRLESGKAIVGGMALDYPEAKRDSGKEARIFVRPHDLDLDTHTNGKPHFPAHIRHINAAGPRVRIELADESGRRVDVELPHERFRQLNIACGARVYVTPKEIRVFTEDYVI